MARPGILKALFGRAAKAEPAPVAEVAADRQAAGVELLAAQRAVEAAEAAYGGALLDIGADLPALDDARREAGRRLDRAKALMKAFEEQHSAAQAAERQAELDRIIAEADAAQAAFRDLVDTDLPLVGTAVRGILRAWAEAEVARERANRAIAAAGTGARRPPVEAFRAASGRPERVLRSERIEYWTDSHGNPAAHQDQIRLQSDGTGTVRAPNATYSKTLRHRRTFEIAEILEAERHEVPELLAHAIFVPGVTPRDNPAWVPLSDPTPERVFAALDRLERHVEPSIDTRQPRTVTRPVGPVREVTKVNRTQTIELQQSVR